MPGSFRNFNLLINNEDEDEDLIDINSPISDKAPLLNFTSGLANNLVPINPLQGISIGVDPNFMLEEEE